MNKLMKAVLCLLTAAVLMLAFAACGSDTNGSGESDDNSSSATDIQDATEETDTFTIDTKYGKVEYPTSWKDKAEIKTSDSKIEVAMKTEKSGSQKVFDICFGGKEGNLVGTLEDGGVNVYVVTYEPDKKANLTDKEKENFYAMTDDLNYILQSLNNDCGMEYSIANAK